MSRRNVAPGLDSPAAVAALWRAAARSARGVLEVFGYGAGDGAPSPLRLAQHAGVPVVYSPDRSPETRMAAHGFIGLADVAAITDLDPHPLRGEVDVGGHRMTLLIRVDKALPLPLRRFVIGHELGHYFLETRYDDYRPERWPTEWWFDDLGWAVDPKTHFEAAELACDAFAVRLCMQNRVTSEEVREYKSAFERGDLAAIRRWRVAHFAEIDEILRRDVERSRNEAA